jgi:hypothetical protein
MWCTARTTPSRSARGSLMGREKKPPVVVRVPNPRAPVKGRLKTPSHKVHRSKKAYRRTPKHPAAPSE